MHKHARAWAGALALTAGLAAASPALAQDASKWPERPVRLIVGFVPGGGTDVSARILSARLSALLGQQVVVENKPGASGLIAADFVAKADPDGYTLLLANMQSTVAAPYVVQSSVDPIKDFTPVRYIGSVPNVLVVNPAKHSYASVQNLVDDARAKPKQLTYASSGMGSPQHLSAARFSQIAGVSMEHVPYKGSGQAMTDLLGGSVDMNFDTLPGAINQIQAGKLRPLAVTSTERSKRLPDVPTLAESGIKGLDIVQLDQALSQTLADPEIKAKLADQGMELGGGPATPAAFASYVQDEWSKYGKLTASLGLTKQ
jgi:tripartite-type tricarboxylate transporter receptor subunit TctC